MVENTTPMSKKSEKPYKLEPNIEAALAYLFTPFSGIFIFMMEKENKFVRFHAVQSILFGIVIFVIYQLIKVLNLVFIGYILSPIISLVGFIVWLVLVWKAYNNEELELPVIGEMARTQVNK